MFTEYLQWTERDFFLASFLLAHTVWNSKRVRCVYVLTSQMRLEGSMVRTVTGYLHTGRLNSMAPKPEVWSPRSQEHATGSYSEPVESSPHPRSQSPLDPF
jgi:hypothetical protein